MWSDAVTIYRKTDGRLERTVCNNCRFEVKVENEPNILGDGRKYRCFLAVPAGVSVQPGDWVAYGVGGEDVPQDAMALEYVKPCWLHGQLHHTEAGADNAGKKNF